MRIQVKGGLNDKRDPKDFVCTSTGILRASVGDPDPVRSGSGRIRTFLPDPDPENLTRIRIRTP
jgi:hypothetical protein